MRFVFIFFVLLISKYMDALPAHVMIIRHAEKIENSEVLSLKGEERAMALVPFFLNNEEYLKLGEIAAIFATKRDENYKSFRPQETASPLSIASGLKLRIEFDVGQLEPLAKEILEGEEFDKKTVLICWEHHHIPKLAKLLGAKDSPEDWSDSAFDRVWIIGYEGADKVIFQDNPQRLLFGDSEL